MLTLTALTFIAKGVIAYYAARKCHESIANTTETDKDSEAATIGSEQEAQTSESAPPVRNIVDSRCEILFDKIALVLKNPNEESVYTLESLFIQLRFHYPYKYL